jgi:hypothetical protein
MVLWMIPTGQLPKETLGLRAEYRKKIKKEKLRRKQGRRSGRFRNPQRKRLRILIMVRRHWRIPKMVRARRES